MTSERTFTLRRQPLLATFAAVAFLGAFGVAQAQSQQGTSPTQVNPSATDTNREASQGMQPSRSDTRTDTMRSDPSTSGSTMSSTPRGSSSSMTTQSGTSGAAGSPTQVNPDAQDTNRAASQGMVPPRDGTTAQSRINAPDSDLRNDRTMRDDRTTMARAPRADRN